MKSIAQRILLLLIVFSYTPLILKAQPVFISGSIDSKDLKQINFYQFGGKINGETNRKYDAAVKPNGTFHLTIKNPEEGLYKIGDAYIGHKIFISPGDTVRIQLNKIAKPSFEIFHRMKAFTRYPMNYMFFDSCLSFFGRVKPQFDKSNLDDNTYKKECLDGYHKALDLLKHFHRQNQVSDSFFKYAQIELKSNYFDWLMFPFAKYQVSKESIDPDYFKELEDFHFNDLDATAKTEYYLFAANEYNNFGLNVMDRNNLTPWLYSSFTNAANHFEGFVRDRLMAWKIEEIMRGIRSEDSSKFKAVLSYFFKECKTSSIKDEVTRKVGAWALKIKNTPVLFHDLTNEPLYSNIMGKEFSLNTLPVKKRWILIDCWASWCKPCKIQEPFFEYFKEKYKNSISFLNFSLDEDRLAWQKDIDKYKKDSMVNYLVRDGNENPFSYFFEIKSIPRFILIDLENQKVVNDNMPFPEHKEQFEQVINDVLQGK